MDWYQDVKDFHTKHGLNIGDKPSIPAEYEQRFRETLILEEITETLDALKDKNLVELADGIADSIYVLLGCAISYGIDLRPVWDEVQKSNMSKDTGDKRGDGKVIKGPNFQPPDIISILEEQGYASL